MFSESEVESTFEVIVMDEGQSYTAFSSRGLLDMIGDLNNKALEASRMKDFIGILGGRFLNWAQRKSLFPLHLGVERNRPLGFVEVIMAMRPHGARLLQVRRKPGGEVLADRH